MTEQEKNIAWFILSYLGILAVIPLLMEQEDEEVQWHAKHGLVLFGAEMILVIAILLFTALVSLIPLPLWILSCLVWAVVWLGLIALHVVLILKACRGERLIIPYLSPLADKF